MKTIGFEETDTMSFKNAVDSIPDFYGGYCKGLKAMKADSSKIIATDNRCLSGSVDIDTCTKQKYPSEARWDYAIGYKEKAYFVEVHSANTSDIKEMLKKASWLECWLKTDGKALEMIRKDELLFWVPSGKVKIIKTSPQYRRLSTKRIVITSNPFRLE